MPFDPRTTAVVLIEYQNDFVSEGGALHGAVEAVMDKTDMLANTKKMVQAARAAGATIMHAPITFAPGLAQQGNRDACARRLPHQLLRRVDDAQRL